MLAAYIAALEHAKTARDADSFAQLHRQREALIFPYELWGATARRTALLIAFDELARRGPSGTKEIGDIVDRFSQAAGLTAEDAQGVKLDLYRTIVWHLLAADRIGKSQTQQLDAIRRGLGIGDEETKNIEQFQRIRGMTPEKLPRVRCTIQLQFQEHCIYETATDRGTLHVTNKRMILDAKKGFDMPIASGYDVVVNTDQSMVTLKTENPKKPLRLGVDEPVFTAAILDTASQIDERPRGFA
jgi:hypothetical protein